MTNEQQLVYDGLMSFYEANKGGGFDGQKFVAHMEPVFRQAGFREGAVPGRQQHILILRDDAAGDFVLNSPFMREVRRLYPAAHITLFASRRNEDLARCCPYIDNILINTMEFVANNFWKVFRDLVSFAVEHFLPFHYDLAFSGRLGIRSADVLLMYMSGANRRVAYTQDRPMGGGKIARIGWDGMITVPVPMRQEIESDVARDLFMLEYLLQLPITDRHTEVWTVPADREAAEAAMAPLRAEPGVKRLYAVMLSTSEGFREWPVERFEAFFQELLSREEEQDVGLLVFGGRGDVARTEAFAAKFPHRAFSVAGKLDFRGSAAAVALCEKYIGNDTGLSHLAAAQHVPVLNIFPFPAELGLHPMSCPVRFQPYGVPAVVVIPPVAADKECNLWGGTGCKGGSEPHCILGVTVEKFLQGYDMLVRHIAERENTAIILK